jgi:hypothetical protein
MGESQEKDSRERSRHITHYMVVCLPQYHDVSNRKAKELGVFESIQNLNCEFDVVENGERQIVVRR